MRFRLVTFSLTMIITLAFLIPTVNADIVVTLDMNEVSLMPTMLGNTTAYPDEDMKGFSVTSDGTMFTVSHNTDWETIRGQTPVSLIAWRNNGSIIWSHQYGSFDRVLYDVTNDGTHVYVTGQQNENVFIGKFDFDGLLEWNATYDLGYTERGFRIAVMEDGTIIIGGLRRNDYPFPVVFDYFLLALNQTGNVQWTDYSFGMLPSMQCDSNYLYVSTNFTVQKRESSGSIVWSSNNSMLGGFGCVSDNVLYTVLNANPSLTSLSITTWNLDSGDVLDSFSLQLRYDDQTAMISASLQVAGTQYGSMNLLISIPMIDSWYLLNIYQTELTHFRLILEGVWSDVLLDMDSIGNVYIASDTESYGLTVMRFDSTQLASSSSTTTGSIGNGEMIDYQAVAITIIGVVVFDTVLILYMKRRVSN
ncbi:MAG: hypothetical protein ACFFEE_06890 [Candidatus Thorarchaeota archaeon]